MSEISLKPIDNINIKIQKTEPVVFDDSITLYEFLGKLQHAINELVDNNNQLPDYIAQELQSNFQELYDRVTALEGRADDIEPILNTLVNNLRSLTDNMDTAEVGLNQYISDNADMLDDINQQLASIPVGDSTITDDMVTNQRYLIAAQILKDITAEINNKLNTQGQPVRPNEMAQKIHNIGTEQDELTKWLEGANDQTITDDDMKILARTIRPNAFKGWSNLPVTLIFGPEVAILYNNIFNDATRCTTLNISEAVNLGNIPAYFFGRTSDNDTNTLTSVVNTSNKPNIRSIGERAFQGALLTNFDFTKLPNLESIGQNAFLRNHLSTLDLSNCKKLASIGPGAFARNMRNFTAITFPTPDQGVTLIIGEYAFDWSQGSGSDAGNNCGTVTFPANVVAKRNGFRNSNARKIIILGDDADANKTSYSASNLGYTYEANFSNSTSLEEIVINGQRIIGDSGFSGCTALKSVTINDCFMLGKYAFRGIKAITSINIYGLFAIRESAFDNAFSETNPPARLVLPASLNQGAATDNDGYNVASVEARAFANANIPEIDLSACTHVDYLQDRCFQGSAAVTIKLPPNLKKITGDYTFENCTNLVNLEMPGTLEEASGFNMFKGASNLNNITLGDDWHIDFNFRRVWTQPTATAWHTTATNLRNFTSGTHTLQMTQAQRNTMAQSDYDTITGKGWTIQIVSG